MENTVFNLCSQAVSSQCLRQQQQLLEQQLINQYNQQLLTPQQLPIVPFPARYIEPCSHNPIAPLAIPNVPVSIQQVIIPSPAQQSCPYSPPIIPNVPIPTQPLFIPSQQSQLFPNVEYISSITPNVPCSPPVITPVQQQGSTILITDSSPSACQNLADTLQLMIVCNMLQNNLGAQDIGLQMATPVINELMTSPVLSCGCSNPIYAGGGLLPNVVANSNFIQPSYSW